MRCGARGQAAVEVVDSCARAVESGRGIAGTRRGAGSLGQGRARRRVSKAAHAHNVMGGDAEWGVMLRLSEYVYMF